MAGEGNPELIANYGERLRRQPELEPAVPEKPPLLGGDGMLSMGLAGIHDQMAIAAAKFARAKDSGLLEAGTGLIDKVAMNLSEFDRKGAESIQALFPDQAPGTGGGQR